MKTMNLTLSFTLLGIGAMLHLTPPAAAQPGPSGSFTNTVTDPSNAVWDFGGLITNVDISIASSDTQVEVSFPVAVQQTGAGKLSGSASGVTVTLSTDGSVIHFSGSVKTTGSVTSTGPGAHVMLTTTVTGTATLPGDTAAKKVSARLQVNGVISTNRTISGQSMSQASAAGKGSISETDNFGPMSVNAIPGIAPLGDGSWTLTLMNLTTTGNKIAGTAQVALNAGQVLNYSVKGTFKSTTGLSKLVLGGSDTASKGSILQVMMNGNTVQSISGRIAGQNVNASF